MNKQTGRVWITRTSNVVVLLLSVKRRQTYVF